MNIAMTADETPLAPKPVCTPDSTPTLEPGCKIPSIDSLSSISSGVGGVQRHSCSSSRQLPQTVSRGPLQFSHIFSSNTSTPPQNRFFLALHTVGNDFPN